jgi:hypothetical protein
VLRSDRLSSYEQWSLAIDEALETDWIDTRPPDGGAASCNRAA